MTPRKPLIFLVKFKGFCFSAFHCGSLNPVHLEGDLEGRRGRNPPNSSVGRVRNRSQKDRHEDIQVHPFSDPDQQREAEALQAE